jgi:DNA-binding beta-propeller fold protein YncE
VLSAFALERRAQPARERHRVWPVAVDADRVGALVFDGTHIWVANGESNNLMKLRTIDGAVVGTFSVGMKPAMVAFDGGNIWVTNENSNNVMMVLSPLRSQLQG